MNERDGAIERTGFWLLAGCLGVVQFKIAPAQILFGLAAICWLVLILREGKRPALPSFFLPLTLYAGWTLVSAAMSNYPRESFVDSKQLLLFLMVAVVARFARGRDAMTVIDIVIALGAAGALIGIIQFTMLGYDHLNERPTGLLSHYMTFSGILMLVTCAAAARLLFYKEQRIWPAVAMPALLVALALTLTQNAWIGTIVALGCLVAIRQVKLLLLAPLVLGLAFLIAPGEVRSRVANGFSPQTESNRDRIQMLGMGADIVRDHPVFGVGPENIGRVYGQYLRPNPVHIYNPHLHNVPMQIAAERGLLALALFAWFVVSALTDAWRQMRHGPFRAIAATAFAAIVAMITAGFFEYNFGDSEFLMLFLGLIALPFAARSVDDPAPGLELSAVTALITGQMNAAGQSLQGPRHSYWAAAGGPARESRHAPIRAPALRHHAKRHHDVGGRTAPDARGWSRGRDCAGTEGAEGRSERDPARTLISEAIAKGWSAD